MDSSASDFSVEARQPRHREDPTRERGKFKRVMTALTTDSDTRPDSPRGTDRDNRHLGQVSPRVYNAPDPNDGTVPPSPPRIARPRGNRRIVSPRHLPARKPALEPPTLRGDPILDETPHPPLTPQSLEMITAATIAVLNQHLASIGLLPRTAASPSDEPIRAADPQPPAPRAAPPALTRTLPAPSSFVPTVASTPAFHSTNPSSNDAHYLYEDSMSHSSSSPPQHGFRRDFNLKMQAENRTLDTRRVPRVQPLPVSAHTDRTAATQLLVHSMRDALSGIFDVADPSGSVTMRSPTWVSG